MPDPRFDGSLDAPLLVDRAECADCGQRDGHPNHDGRNERGHFFNTGEPLIRERVMPLAVAKTTPVHAATLASAPVEPDDELEPIEYEDDPPEPIPGPEWSAAIEAVGQVKDRSSCNVTAAALRYAPAAATARDLSIIVRHAADVHEFKATLNPPTVSAALLSLRNAGLADSELRLGRDNAGVLRKLGHWWATEELLNMTDDTLLPKLNRPSLGRQMPVTSRSHRVDVRIGEHSFSAEGDAESVAAQYGEWIALVEAIINK